MNELLIGLYFIGAIVILLVVIRLWMNKLENNNKTSSELVEWIKELGQRLESSTVQVDQKLSKNMEMFNTRLDKAAYVIANVQKTIGEFSEIGRSMQELQEFLQSPKIRGNIGEQILKDLLAQYFPQDVYKLQYVFKSGEKVDAILKTSQGIIPIDAKFPSENFRKMMSGKTQIDKEKFRKLFEQDVKKHITDISKKYINVAEGTLDYALMYIPSESIYYEIINNAEIFDYAGDNRILPVSPMSFYAYMKAILMSFEGQRIQAQAKEILNILKSVQKDYEKTEDALSVLSRHVTNASNQLPNVARNFGSLGQKISATNTLTGKEKAEKLLE